MKKLIIVFFIFIILGCGNSHNSKSKSVLESPDLEYVDFTALSGPEPIDSGQLLITFSTSNGLLNNYSLFKLGLIDIIAIIEVEGTLYRHSMHSKEIPSDIYLDDVLGIDLSAIREDEFLYHGFFNVPAGKLKSLEVAFSGSRSQIGIDGKQLTFIDDLFCIFNHENIINTDDMCIQTLPVITSVDITDSIHIDVGDMEMITINVDLDMSVMLDGFQSDEESRVYALFNPIFTVDHMPKSGDFVKPFKIRLKGINDIDFSEPSIMIFGDPLDSVFLTGIDVADTENLFLNQNPVDTLSAIKGLYYVDLSGELILSETGYNMTINEAHFTEADAGFVRYEGFISKLTDEGIVLNGQYLSLDIDQYSHLGGDFFSGLINGDFSEYELNQYISIIKDTTTEAIVSHGMNERNKASERFQILDIFSGLSLIPNDLLSLKYYKNSQIIDTIILQKVIACSDWIFNIDNREISSCQENTIIDKLVFSEDTGYFQALTVRQGQIDQFEDGTDDEVFIKQPSLVKSFLNTKDFVQYIKKQEDEGSRLVRFRASGFVQNNLFTITTGATALFIKKQAGIDELYVLDEGLPKVLRGDWTPKRIWGKLAHKNKIKKSRYKPALSISSITPTGSVKNEVSTVHKNPLRALNPISFLIKKIKNQKGSKYIRGNTVKSLSAYPTKGGVQAIPHAKRQELATKIRRELFENRNAQSNTNISQPELTFSSREALIDKPDKPIDSNLNTKRTNDSVISSPIIEGVFRGPKDLSIPEAGKAFSDNISIEDMTNVNILASKSTESVSPKVNQPIQKMQISGLQLDILTLMMGAKNLPDDKLNFNSSDLKNIAQKYNLNFSKPSNSRLDPNNIKLIVPSKPTSITPNSLGSIKGRR